MFNETDTEESLECDSIYMMLGKKQLIQRIDAGSAVVWVERRGWFKQDLRDFYEIIEMFYILSAVDKNLIKWYS